MVEIVAFLCGSLLTGIVAWQMSLRWLNRRSEQQRRLLRRTKRVERLAQLGTLTGDLAHEIRNPLSTIKVNLQLLSEDIARQQREGGPSGLNGVNDMAQRYQRQLRKIETIADETDRLTHTLNDFLKYAGRMELHPTNCNLNELLDELIDFYEPQAISRGVQIRRNLGKTPAKCHIDVDMIKQALLNLFINAVQATNGRGELIVRSATSGDLVKVDVIDTGTGIPTDDQERIFDAYYTTKSGGTGLGLATCRRIIEEHEGHIDLHSEPGKGSNFTITLPLIK